MVIISNYFSNQNLQYKKEHCKVLLWRIDDDYMNCFSESEQSESDDDNDSVIDYVGHESSDANDSHSDEGSDVDDTEGDVEELFVTTRSGRNTTSWKAHYFR